MRLAAFVAAHESYVAAEKNVALAATALHAAEGSVADADVEQDAAVEVLATKLAGDGHPRKNPFAPLGFFAPAQVEKLSNGAEAKVIHKLVAEVRKREGLSKDSLAAAKDLDGKATAVEKLLAKVEPLAMAYASAITTRTALGRPWASAFAKLKTSARAADEDEGAGRFEVLFGIERKASRKKGKKAVAPAALGAKG